MLEFFMNLNQSLEGQAFLAHLLVNSNNRINYYEQIQHFNTITNLYNMQSLGLIDSSWKYYAMPSKIFIPNRCDGLLWNYYLNDFIYFQYKYIHNNAYRKEALFDLYKNYIDTHIIQIGTDNSQICLEQLYNLIEDKYFSIFGEQICVKNYNDIHNNLTNIEKERIWSIIREYNEAYNLKQHNIIMRNHHNISSYMPLRNGLESVVKLFLK